MISTADIANVHDIRGLKADLEALKDTGDKKKIGNGSTFICMDTGEVYIYDMENDEWLLLS